VRRSRPCTTASGVSKPNQFTPENATCGTPQENQAHTGGKQGCVSLTPLPPCCAGGCMLEQGHMTVLMPSLEDSRFE